MVQINTYSFSQSGQRIAPNFSDRTRKLEFQLVGGEGGFGGGQYRNDSNAPGGAGGSVSGTYNIDLSSDDKFIRVYPGEALTSDDSESDGGVNYFGNAGDGDGSNGFGSSSGGGAMSAIALMQENNSGTFERAFLAAAGGGGGAGKSNGDAGNAGGGGFPGGKAGKTEYGNSNPTDADTMSDPFVQDLGGKGGSDGYNGASNGEAGGTAVAGFISNTSTGTARGTAKVDVQTYGLPTPVTDITTSISSNYYPVLSWSAANNGITQRIYRKERTENSFSQVGTLTDSAGTFTDTSTTANTTYSYKIVQDNNYYQESNTSIIHTPDERVQVYRNGSWEPATLHTY
jgi:hypothetical protein